MRLGATLLALLGLPLAAADFTVGSVGGSPIPIGAGARALGMGGAFSAVADDVTAPSWNPAGMAQIERPELGASGGYYRIDSGADGERSDRDEWRLEHLGAVLPFHLGGFQQAVGVSWQRQFDLTASVAFGSSMTTTTPFLVETESRTAFERDGGQASLGLSYAMALTDRLNLGVAANLWQHGVTGDSDYSARQVQRDVSELNGSTRISDQTVTTIDAEIDAGSSFGFGAQWRALPQLSLALVLQPGFDLELDQTVRTRSSSETVLIADGSVIDASASSQRQDQSVEVHHPTSVTLGIAWRPSDLQLLALDVTWTQWSDFSQERGGRRVSAFSNLLEPEDVDDDFALRLGYEQVVILPRWVLAARGGLLYERLPGLRPLDSLDTVQGAAATTEEWYGVSLGLTAFRRSVTYDCSARLRWGDEVGAGVHAAPDETAEVLELLLRAGASYLF